MDELIKQLKSIDRSVRQNALRQLVSTKSLEAEKLILDIFESTTEDTQIDIIDSSLLSQNQDYFQKLMSIVTTQENKVACAAATALGKIQKEEAISALIQALLSSNSNLRANAVWALGQIKDFRTIKNIITVLNDEDKWVRISVLRALGDFNDKSNVRYLKEALSDKEPLVRSTVITILGQLGDTHSVQDLIPLLKDKVLFVREATIEALGLIKNDEAIEPLKDILKDEAIGKKAALALSKFGEKGLLVLFEIVESDNNNNCRWNAIYALGESRDKRAISILSNIVFTAKDVNSKGAKIKDAVNTAIERIKSGS